jgi:cytochrome d ubiquinol oxidase subunit II
MIVLWLLILRGISIEFRNHVESLVWHPLWDAIFAGASALLAIFFGAALGNVVRGVPLNSAGEFFLPLWTDLLPGKEPGILDWYTILIAVAALIALTVHGALWVALKTSGALQRRSRRVVNVAWLALLPAVVLITLSSFRLQPHLQQSFAERPWGYLFPILALAGLVGIRLLGGLDGFLSSCLFLFGMLTSAAFGLYPYVLPSNSDPALSLSIYNAAAPLYGLQIGLFWFIPGTLLAIGYFVYTYRHSAGKVG